MKKIFFTLAISTTLLAGAIFTGCQSPAQKEEAARAKIENAEQDLDAAKEDADALKVATAEEWELFKTESELKIRTNEARIAELKAKQKRSGEAFDKVYQIKIDTLEQRNKDLQARMDAYETNKTDWESFKREFNNDMDELGQAFKDLKVEIKK